MNFIYHGVPEQMVGTTLVPLNAMDGDLAATRQKNLEKYKGREEVLQKTVPVLNCLWNDVIQFLPLHPQRVFELQRDLGLISEVPSYRFFEIPVDLLDSRKTVVFFKSAPGDENISVRPLSDVDLSTLQDIPAATIAYYTSLIGSGELPFNYQFIPHVLYQGSVDIATSKVVITG